MKLGKQVNKTLKGLGIPKVVRNNITPRTIMYLGIAYVGLRFLNSRGIMPQQTGAALDAIDRGVDNVKSTLGFEKKAV